MDVPLNDSERAVLKIAELEHRLAVAEAAQHLAALKLAERVAEEKYAALISVMQSQLRDHGVAEKDYLFYVPVRDSAGVISGHQKQPNLPVRM